MNKPSYMVIYSVKHTTLASTVFKKSIFHFFPECELKTVENVNKPAHMTEMNGEIEKKVLYILLLESS